MGLLGILTERQEKPTHPPRGIQDRFMLKSDTGAIAGKKQFLETMRVPGNEPDDPLGSRHADATVYVFTELRCPGKTSV